jgi:hypothetical protein
MREIKSHNNEKVALLGRCLTEKRISLYTSLFFASIVYTTK